MRGGGSEEEEEEEEKRKGKEAEEELSLVMRLFNSGIVFREGSKLLCSTALVSMVFMCRIVQTLCRPSKETALK